MSIIFSAGCFSSGKSATENQRKRKKCQCTNTISDWQQRDMGKQPAFGGSISMRIESEPGTLLSMYTAHPAVAQIIDHDVLEALVNLDSKTGNPIPELATYWETDLKQTSYTFYLAESARWHDGQPFTADDVVFTFKHMLDPAGGALGRARFEDVANVEVLTRYSVLFELDNPRSDFLADVSRVMILPEHLLKNTTIVSNEFVRAPVGTGPFVFSDWQPGQHIEITRSSDWRGQPPYLDRITYTIIPERRVALELFASGNLDIVTNARDATHPNAVTVDFPEDQLNTWVFNTRTPYFSDAKTRRAVSRLIDRNAIACAIMNCLARPASSPWPEIAQPQETLSFSPKDARMLLQEAGWRDSDRNGILDRGGMPFRFNLLLPDTDLAGTRAVALIMHDLRKAGIDARPTTVSWAVYTDRLRKQRFDASIVAISTAPPFNAAELFHSDGIGSGRNFGDFRDRRIDSMFDRLTLEQAPEARRRIRQKLAERLVLLQPMVFIFFGYQRSLVRHNIFGVETSVSGIEERFLWLASDGGTTP
ncbi:MAG: hypothetical protein JXR76_26575 [Deltaproteobacteria bacterium]|nr:hypothetical protein [Deltaproteobacteria bacterium]